MEDTYTPRTRGRVFYQGYIQLTDHDGVAGIHGETLAEVEADEVGLNLYLEKYNGSNFDSYKYWKTVEYNVSKNIKSYQISVPKAITIVSGVSTTLTQTEFMRAGALLQKD